MFFSSGTERTIVQIEDTSTPVIIAHNNVIDYKLYNIQQNIGLQ